MRRIINVVAACCLVTGPALAAAQQDTFSQGTSAFKRGDYTQALALFETARERGNRSANLSYNMGVTLYKLGRYGEAADWFETLLDSPEWRDLALFQLGMVAEKRDQPELAERRYEMVTASRSAKLRRMAAARLETLEAPPAPAISSRAFGRPGKRGAAMLNVAAGYDDNVFALRDELQVDSTVGEDTYTDIFAWGQYRLAGTATDGWRVSGYAFQRAYSEWSVLDLTSYSAGVARDIRWGDWQLELGGAVAQVTLDGEQLTREMRLEARAKQRIGDSKLELAYIPSQFSGGDGYAYLDGIRQRFEAEWKHPLGAAKLEALYRLDLNDREDLVITGADGDSFYSYSPVRHTFGAELLWPLAGSWRLSVGSEYRLSTYDGENRLTDSDGVLREEQRQADRVEAWVGSQWMVTPRLRLAGKVTFTNNDENFETYTHDKTEANVGVTYIF